MTEINPQNSSNDSPTNEKSVNLEDMERDEAKKNQKPFQGENYKLNILGLKNPSQKKDKPSYQKDNLNNNDLLNDYFNKINTNKGSNKGEKSDKVNNNESFEISISDMSVNEDEELIDELLNENNDGINEKKDTKINKVDSKNILNMGNIGQKIDKILKNNQKMNNIGQKVDKLLKNKIYNFFSENINLINKESEQNSIENKLLNIKRKYLEMNEHKTSLNKNMYIHNKTNQFITEEEKLIYSLIKKYSFEIVFKKCLQNNLDINKDLDKEIIILNKKL